MIGNNWIKAEDTGKLYAYSIHDPSGRCLFVGFDTLASAMAMNQVKGNPVFSMAAVMNVRLHSVHETRVSAYNAIAPLIAELSPTICPPLNMTSHANRYLQVVCDQTGEVYQNANRACEALGVDNARLSRHLARKPGHRSIKGFTFHYINPHDRDADLARKGFDPITGQRIR